MLNTKVIDNIKHNLAIQNESEVDSNDSTNLNFEEFCAMFQKIYENSQNPKQIFLEGFAFLDSNK